MKTHAAFVLLVAFFAVPGAAQSQAVKPEPAQSKQAPATQASPQGTTEPAPSPPDSTHLSIIKFEKPVYPIAAAEEGIQGQVWVHLVITEKGDVESADPVSGDPMLLDSAMRAMKKWKFKPYIRNGQPVRVSTKMAFDFAFRDKIVDKTAPAGTGDVERLPRVKVSDGVSAGLLIHKVQPVYPPEAKLKTHSGHRNIAGLHWKGRRAQKAGSHQWTAGSDSVGHWRRAAVALSAVSVARTTGRDRNENQCQFRSSMTAASTLLM